MHVHGQGAEAELHDLERSLPLLVGQPLPETLEQVDALVDTLALSLASRCATELALLDAMGRARGIPVLRLLGRPTDRPLHYSAVIPLLEPLEVAGAARRAHQMGFGDVKLKLGGAPWIGPVRTPAPPRLAGRAL